MDDERTLLVRDAPLTMMLDGSGDFDFSLFDSDLWSADAAESTTGSSSSTAHSDDDSTASPSTSIETAEPPKRPVRRRTPQSQRVKEEKAFLQQQIVELQRQLSVVMGKRAVEQASAPSAAWRDVAKRQFRRREHAEEENTRLKAKILHQLQVAKSLERVFLKRELTDSSSPDDASSCGRYTSHSDGDIGTVFGQFMDDLQQAYAAVDMVLPLAEDDGLVPIDERPMCRSTIKAHDTNGVEKLYVEMRHSFVLPFAFDRICALAWRTVTTDFAHRNREVREFTCNSDVFACQFLASDDRLPATSQEQVFTVMVRQFVSPDRLMIVWRALRCAKGGSLRDANASTTGWLVARPLKDRTNHTVLHLCNRGLPLQSELMVPPTPVRQDPHAMFQLTSQMLCSTFAEIATVADALESVLLDDLIGSQAAARSEQIVAL